MGRVQNFVNFHSNGELIISNSFHKYSLCRYLLTPFLLAPSKSPAIFEGDRGFSLRSTNYLILISGCSLCLCSRIYYLKQQLTHSVKELPTFWAQDSRQNHGQYIPLQKNVTSISPQQKEKIKNKTHTQKPPTHNPSPKTPKKIKTFFFSWSSVAFPHGNRELLFQITNATITQGISNIPHTSTRVANSHGNCGPARISWQPCLFFLICLLSTFQTSSLKEVHAE